MNIHSPFRLGPWTVNPIDGTIKKNGNESRRLQPRVMELLCRLARTPGEVISRDQLIQDVWEGRAMTDEPLHRCIAELRAALDDDCSAPRYVETLPRRGYRLVADVTPGLARASRIRRGAPYAFTAFAFIIAAILAWHINTSAQDVPRLLVLPLKSLSSDPEHQLLADGLTEELINALARLDLAVLSRSTTFAFRESVDTSRLRTAVNPDYFLEGSVRIIGGSLRVAVQLVDARTNTHIMSEAFSQPLSIASATLDDIAVAVSRRASRTLMGDERWAFAPGTSFSVYRKFIEARHLWQNDRKHDIRRAIVLLEDVVQQSPTAAVHANLAAAYYALRNRDADRGQHDGKIDHHLELALALKPEQPLATALTGALIDDVQPSRALMLLDRALEADPALARAKLWKMQILYRAGYLEAANNLARQLHELDPLSEETAGWLASLELDLSNFESFFSLVHLSEAMGWKYSDTLLFYAALRQQDASAARFHLKRRWSHSTRVTPAELDLVVDAIFNERKRGEAIALVHEMLARERPITRFWGFVWLDLLGAHDDAIDLMIKDRQRRDVRVLYSIWGPGHRALRKHPRFHELVAHFGLFELWQTLGNNGFCTGKGETLRCD